MGRSAAITITWALLEPDIVECRVHHGPCTKLRLRLLPQAMFSGVWYAGADETSDEVTLALARVVTAHGFSAPDRRQLDDEFDALMQIVTRHPPLRWPDLPAVIATPPELRGQLSCRAFRQGAEGGATLFLTHQTAIPMGWLSCSSSAPARSLLLAVGRVIIEHAETFPHNALLERSA